MSRSIITWQHNFNCCPKENIEAPTERTNKTPKPCSHKLGYGAHQGRGPNQFPNAHTGDETYLYKASLEIPRKGYSTKACTVASMVKSNFRSEGDQISTQSSLHLNW